MILENLQYASIIIEGLIALIGLIIVFKKHKSYGYGIFLTFAIYVFYDYSRLANYRISSNILYLIFFIATLSMLLSVWMIYKDRDKNKNKKKKR